MSINIGNGTANLTYGLDLQDMRNLTLAGDGDTSTVLLNNISGGESTMAIVLLVDLQVISQMDSMML